MSAFIYFITNYKSLFHGAIPIGYLSPLVFSFLFVRRTTSDRLSGIFKKKDTRPHEPNESTNLSPRGFIYMQVKISPFEKAFLSGSCTLRYNNDIYLSLITLISKGL